MREKATIVFKASSGTEYELQVLYDPMVLISPPSELTEGPDGVISMTGSMTLYSATVSWNETGCIQSATVKWDSLSEMSRELRMEIVSWGSDLGN